MVAFEVARERFEAANAQVLGISVDHVYSHAAWAEANGGFGYPLLADFNPHGEVTRRYQVRALPSTFVVDRQGVIRSVIFGGPLSAAVLQTTVDALLAEAP